ncbi:N-acetylmuramoyl-L-alanine amidase family protein [Erysipelothrix sp. P66]|uniref:N-acetylmuramoyl-L-alanine amidase family protein n=1 Tax=Erysipelothrix sp. P66 TaxID=3141531 RepID=UPI00315C5252
MTYRTKHKTRFLKCVLCACIGFTVLMHKTTLINAQELTQAEQDLKYYSELTPDRALIMFKAYLYSFEGMTEERANHYINQVKKLPVDQQAAKIVALKKPFEERKIRETRLKAIEALTEEIRGQFFYIPSGVKENYIELIQSAPLEALATYREELLALDKKNSLMADIYLKLRDDLFKMKFLTQSEKNHYDNEMESAYNDKNEYMMQSVFKRAQEANEKARLKAPETLLENAKVKARSQINRLYTMEASIDHEFKALPNTAFYQGYKPFWKQYQAMRIPKAAMLAELENKNRVEDVEAYVSQKVMHHMDFVSLEYSARKALSLAQRYPNLSSVQTYLAEDIFKTWPQGDLSGLSFVADKRLQRIEDAIQEYKKQPIKPIAPEKPKEVILKNRWEKTAGKSAYFDEHGNRVKNTWKKIGQNNYYFSKDGLPLTGFFNVNQKRYYATAEKGTTSGWHKVHKKWYLTEHDGSIATGWKKVKNQWYYLENSGEMASGWKKVSNKWYYLEESGAMATGWKKINNKWYYLENSGAMATGWKKVNNKWYYLENAGTMATGWKKVNNKWYYLENSGAMAIGWKKINQKWYYLNDSGAMITGRHKIQGKWYRFNQNGAML